MRDEWREEGKEGGEYWQNTDFLEYWQNTDFLEYWQNTDFLEGGLSVRPLGWLVSVTLVRYLCKPTAAEIASLRSQ